MATLHGRKLGVLIESVNREVSIPVPGPFGSQVSSVRGVASGAVTERNLSEYGHRGPFIQNWPHVGVEGVKDRGGIGYSTPFKERSPEAVPSLWSTQPMALLAVCRQSSHAASVQSSVAFFPLHGSITAMAARVQASISPDSFTVMPATL